MSVYQVTFIKRNEKANTSKSKEVYVRATSLDTAISIAQICFTEPDWEVRSAWYEGELIN